MYLLLMADSSVRNGLTRLLRAAGFFRKPVDGAALLDAIDWAIREKTNN